MHFKLTLVVCGVLACLASTSCTSTDTKLPQIDKGDILSSLQINSTLEQKLLNDYELIRQVSSQLSTSNIYDTRLQPVNKHEKCLLPFMVAADDDQQLYWDGDCRGGYASGLGRAVRTDSGIKSTEYLLELDPNKPHTLVTYLRYDNLSSDAEVGYSVLALKNNVLEGSSSTLGYNSDEWEKGNYDLTWRKEDTTNLVSYTRVTDMLNGDVSSIVAYPNFSHDLVEAKDNVLSHIKRTYRMLEGRTTVGLSYIWLKDGRLMMRDNESGQDSVADTTNTQELKDYIASIKTKVDANVDTINDDIDRGFKALATYKEKKCRNFHGFFRGDEVSTVCEYLDNVQHSYDLLKHARQARAKVLDDFSKVQGDKLKDFYHYVQSI